MRLGLPITLMLLVLTPMACTPIKPAVPETSHPTASASVPIAASLPTATEPPTATPTIVPAPTPSPAVRPSATSALSLSPTRSTPISTRFVTLTPDMTLAAQAQATLHAAVWPTPAVGTPPNPYQLIDAALARGEIDIDHASVYRAYALFGSPYLPSRFLGSGLINADGLGAYVYALKDLDLASPATQKFLTGYVTPRVVTQTLTTPTFPAVLPANGLVPGVYVTTLTPQDNVPGANRLAGRWKLDLMEREHATLYVNEKLVVTHYYTLSGDQITLNDLFGSYACDDDQQMATYSWEIQNGALVFKNVNDNCKVRVRLMETYPWNTQ